MAPAIAAPSRSHCIFSAVPVAHAPMDTVRAPPTFAVPVTFGIGDTVIAGFASRMKPDTSLIRYVRQSKSEL